MLKLTEIRKFKDGSANYVWDADKQFFDFYKKQTGKTEIVEKEVSQFIIEQLFIWCDQNSTPKNKIKKEKKS
jgi:hypothetical protein